MTRSCVSLISIEGADWVTGAYIFIRRLLIHDTNDVERSHGLHLARIVRQEGLERILAIARQRGANAIINFQYQNRLKPKEDEEDEPIVEIAATGLACVLKRQLTDWELEMKRQAELSKQASHIAVYS